MSEDKKIAKMLIDEYIYLRKFFYIIIVCALGCEDVVSHIRSTWPGIRLTPYTTTPCLGTPPANSWRTKQFLTCLQSAP
jgi:hypothetical protein